MQDPYSETIHDQGSVTEGARRRALHTIQPTPRA